MFRCYIQGCLDVEGVRLERRSRLGRRAVQQLLTMAVMLLDQRVGNRQEPHHRAGLRGGDGHAQAALREDTREAAGEQSALQRSRDEALEASALLERERLRLDEAIELSIELLCRCRQRLGVTEAVLREQQQEAAQRLHADLERCTMKGPHVEVRQDLRLAHVGHHPGRQQLQHSNALGHRHLQAQQLHPSVLVELPVRPGEVAHRTPNRRVLRRILRALVLGSGRWRGRRLRSLGEKGEDAREKLFVRPAPRAHLHGERRHNAPSLRDGLALGVELGGLARLSQQLRLADLLRALLQGGQHIVPHVDERADELA
mmetsp:Transcript_73474/g.212815  ORF Transcript_73474/g.212815 Transcript_73474/m.212815 type:complete len:315 (+) Transcript_73474:331-1275(+)